MARGGEMNAGARISVLWNGVGAVSAALVLAGFLACAALAAEIPPLTGRVVDAASMIDPQVRSNLESRLAAHEAASSDQVVVATIASLEGEVLEDFANRLFRAWGLGQADQDNGVLLLVARDDRKIRIEVGYGLEGALTDLHAKLIIDNTIVPAFRDGDFSGGISAGVDDILLVLTGDGAELEARARRHQDGLGWTAYLPTLFFVFWVGLFVSIFGMLILAPIFGTRIGPNRYRWLGMDVVIGGGGGRRSSGSGGGWSSGGGGFSGGGGSSGGGGASGGW